ncbi:MAG: retroviral-like aspartic protease [Cyanobacteria bacterium P01_D01_bin.123]
MASDRLDLSLFHLQTSFEVSALFDTGASVNVLPYRIGLQLGARWEDQTISVTLAGNLATVEARGLVVSAQIAHFDPVRLVFAWSLSDDTLLRRFPPRRHPECLRGSMNLLLDTHILLWFIRGDL